MTPRHRHVAELCSPLPLGFLPERGSIPAAGRQGPKSVKAQVMGDELRITSKSRDDLQAVQALVKGADLDFAVQFVNYR